MVSFRLLRIGLWDPFQMAMNMPQKMAYLVLGPSHPPVVFFCRQAQVRIKAAEEPHQGLYLRRVRSGRGKYRDAKGPINTQMRRMYGLFTYMISVKNGDPFKGKWLGKYSRPMEHLGYDRIPGFPIKGGMSEWTILQSYGVGWSSKYLSILSGFLRVPGWWFP